MCVDFYYLWFLEKMSGEDVASGKKNDDVV